MRTIAISIDEETLIELDRLVGGGSPTRPNRSRIVRDAIHEYVSRIRKADDEAREREIVRRHRVRLQQQTAALVKEQTRK